ncbi:MAG TPA: DUF2190 family protein [Opitutales bacterium]|nr:DUF2190 family protein [Opitutales bacterium]
MTTTLFRFRALRALLAAHRPSRCDGTRRPVFANVAQGTHAGYVTATAASAFSGKYLLAKANATAGEVDPCGAGDCPVGVATDEADIGDPLALKILGVNPQSVLVTASGAIAAGAYLYASANGKVQGEPTSAGTYYLVGRALTTATGAGDQLEAETCVPVKLIVLAKPTSTVAAINALTFSSTPTQAQVQALQSTVATLAGDFLAVTGAAASPILLKVLAS